MTGVQTCALPISSDFPFHIKELNVATTISYTARYLSLLSSLLGNSTIYGHQGSWFITTTSGDSTKDFNWDDKELPVIKRLPQNEMEVQGDLSFDEHRYYLQQARDKETIFFNMRSDFITAASVRDVSPARVKVNFFNKSFNPYFKRKDPPQIDNYIIWNKSAGQAFLAYGQTFSYKIDLGFVPRLLKVGSELSLSWENKDFSHTTKGSTPGPALTSQWLKDARFFVLLKETLGHTRVPFNPHFSIERGNTGKN